MMTRSIKALPRLQSKILNILHLFSDIKKSEEKYQKYVNDVKEQREKELEELTKSINQLKDKFPQEKVTERVKYPLLNSIERIGEVFHTMNKVRQQFKGQEDKWAFEYEKALGRNTFEYYFKYMTYTYKVTNL